MFGEEISESPRQPSPWQELDATKLQRSNSAGICYSSDAAQRKALETLQLAVSQHSVGLPPESDRTGHIEYKLRLAAVSNERFHKLVTQLKWRLFEGGGEALYELGVLDSGVIIGLPADELSSSLETLDKMAAELDAQVEIVREIEILGQPVILDSNSDTEDSTASRTDTLSSATSTASPQPSVAVIHESEDYSAEQLNDIPATFKETAHSVPIDSYLAKTHVPNSATRLTMHQHRVRSIPAGQRFCVEVLIKSSCCKPSEDAEDSDDHRAFLDFEGFSPL